MLGWVLFWGDYPGNYRRLPEYKKLRLKNLPFPFQNRRMAIRRKKLNTDELPSEPSDVFKPVGKQVSKSTKPAEQNAASAAKIKMQLDEIDDNVLVDEWEQSKR